MEIQGLLVILFIVFAVLMDIKKKKERQRKQDAQEGGEQMHHQQRKSWDDSYRQSFGEEIPVFDWEIEEGKEAFEAYEPPVFTQIQQDIPPQQDDIFRQDASYHGSLEPYKPLSAAADEAYTGRLSEKTYGTLTPSMQSSLTEQYADEGIAVTDRKKAFTRSRLKTAIVLGEALYRPRFKGRHSVLGAEFRGMINKH